VRFRIDNAHNRAIGRRFDSLKRKTGFFSTTPEYELSGARPYRIYCDKRFADRLQIPVKNPDD
jgi:hypothetical protein